MTQLDHSTLNLVQSAFSIPEKFGQNETAKTVFLSQMSTLYDQFAIKSHQDDLNKLTLTDIQKTIIRLALEEKNHHIDYKTVLSELSKQGMNQIDGKTVGASISGLIRKCNSNNITPIVYLKNNEFYLTEASVSYFSKNPID